MCASTFKYASFKCISYSADNDEKAIRTSRKLKYFRREKERDFSRNVRQTLAPLAGLRNWSADAAADVNGSGHGLMLAGAISDEKLVG